MPPSASWNLPRCLSVAPVNEPFSWPNRIELDQILRDRAAIDGDEGPARPVGRALDRARDQLLADAALTLDQDRDVRLRRAFAEAEHLAHGAGFRDEILEGQTVVRFFLEPRDFMRQRSDLELVSDRDRDAFGARGLDEKIVGAGAHRLDGGIDAALCGQHDDRKIGMADAQLAEHLQPIHVGHDEIEQHEHDLVAARPVDEVERGLAAGRSHRRHAGPRNGRLEQATLHGIVVDNQNSLRHCDSSCEGAMVACDR